jgi:hypothetical protein
MRDSYGALPIASQSAAAAVEFMLGALDRRVPKTSIVPTNRGRIQFEWHCAGADLEIEVESPDVFHVYFADERTGEESEKTFSDNLLPLKPLLDRISTSD